MIERNPRVTLPEYFVATRFPGYFWNVRTQALYSIKSGILKPLKLIKPSKWNKAYRPFYKVSVNGERKTLGLDQLFKLAPISSTIPVHKRTMSVATFEELRERWTRSIYAMPGNIRLGQYLINHMNGHVYDPEIFYERRPEVAAEKFFNLYVDSD